MCGIAGRWNYLSGAPVDPGVLRQMCELIAHRGPDGWGTHCDGPLGLGHRRLAIIDLSDAANQPMSSDDGQAWIVFNGEIYNFQGLRAELEGRGHRFRTHSDTEVLLRGYQEYGTGIIGRLRGMFAFALWDARARRLVIARDRVGKKPLHYRVDRDGIAFASEPKAFLAEAGFHPEADDAAILHYLTYQHVPSPLSAFRGVHKLPPGHMLVVEGDRVTTQRYWTLAYEPKLDIDEPTAIDEILARLREAVRLRMISDVPLGAFLSGGIDSSIVVALMRELASGPVRTFSIGFGDARYNELPHARAIAGHLGTEHHEFVVTPDAIEVLPRLVWHYNEPYSDSSALPTWYLAEMTRRHVTVALNGDGGDESFGGYQRYLANQAATRFARHAPRFVQRGLASLGPLVRYRARPNTPRYRAGRVLEVFAETPDDRYARFMVCFHPDWHDALLTRDFAARVAHADAWQFHREAFASSTTTNLVDRMLDYDVRTYLPEDLLVKVDIATMAHSLEGRSPLLDHEVMEYAARLPPAMKLQGTTLKHLLKQVAYRLLPRTLLDRPKMGFGVPLDAWFRGALHDFARDHLLSSRARTRGIVEPAYVERLLDEHRSGRRPWHYQIWNLLVLELWHEAFIDRARPQSPPARTAP